MDTTLYRRPLPEHTIAFASAEGRRVFAEALAAGGMDGYFRLAEQFHTQSDPAFCGLGSLVVALNALGIDPGRLWKGPWRWFAEDLLDCCVPLDSVRQRGLDLDELGCLARCNGAAVELSRADENALEAWKRAVASAARGDSVLIASYDRKLLDQTGSGHFSPIGGYHAQQNLVLVLDVARFKYPPHWVTAEKLFAAMQPHDPTTGKPRGWLSLRARPHGLTLGFSLRCDEREGGFRDLADRFAAARAELSSAASFEAVIATLMPLGARLELRTPTAEAHRKVLTLARAALRELEPYEDVVRASGEASAEVVMLLLLALVDSLVASQRGRIEASIATIEPGAPLRAEIENLRAQMAAVASTPLGRGLL